MAEHFLTLIFVIGAMVPLVGAAFVLYHLGRTVLYEFHFTPSRRTNGKIIDLIHTPARIYKAGAGMGRRPPKNTVVVATKIKTAYLNSRELFQSVRVADLVLVSYQDRYRRPRFWHGELSFDGHRLNKIECPRSRVVTFNAAMPVSRVLMQQGIAR